jgi:hypothetical protein
VNRSDVPGSTRRRGVGGALALVLLPVIAACATTHRTPKPAATSASSFTTTYGEDAALLAAHIPACSHVTRGRIAAGQTTSAKLVSTCMLLRHPIVVYTWPDATSEHDAELLLSTSPPSYSASGAGWTQIVADNAPLEVQRLIAEQVAQALAGTVTKNG